MDETSRPECVVWEAGIRSGAKQAAEKGRVQSISTKNLPQGLKPGSLFSSVCGTTKVVPFQKGSARLDKSNRRLFDSPAAVDSLKDDKLLG
jgi:hypothetical protein